MKANMNKPAILQNINCDINLKLWDFFFNLFFIYSVSENKHKIDRY